MSPFAAETKKKKKGGKKEIITGTSQQPRHKTEINLTDNRIEDEVKIALNTGLTIELPLLFT